jgi:hypothetical protein
VNGDDRDLRFRRRIDQLIDRVEERDLTIEERDLTIEDLRRIVRRLRSRIYELIRSRDLWKFRARAWRPVRTKAKR